MKTHLSKADLERFRETLVGERNRLLRSVSRAQKIIGHADGEYEGSTGRAHSNHLADMGSDEFDYETQLLLSATQRSYLREIDDALQRIEDGTFGICEKTGKPINKARLKAIPTARLCIEAQEEEDARSEGAI
ncbi:MAG: TraR/DksA C4-type zinc finger protein [Candidatus Krumholzibacteriia bacterium]